MQAGGRAQEIRRFIGRSLRAVANLWPLGERTVYIDCDVLDADGGTRTAAVTGAYVALHDALSKQQAEGRLGPWPLRDYLAGISVGVVQGNALLDLAYTEDSQAEIDLNVVMTGSGEYVELQGTAEKKPFDRDVLEELLRLADSGVRHLVDVQKAVLEGKEDGSSP
jgi:ribonuclease PH